MKIVLQRVTGASVQADGETVGEIGKGFLILLGIAEGDDKATVEKLVDKIAKLRIFADASGKTNLSSSDVGGEILVVSQFTLLADCSQNRPGFSRAAKPDTAKELYEYFLDRCKDKFVRVSCGRFAANMKVQIENDGPFTLVLEG